MKSTFVLLACAISAAIAAPTKTARAVDVVDVVKVEKVKNTIPDGAHLTVHSPTPQKPYWTWVWTWGTSNNSPPPPAASPTTTAASTVPTTAATTAPSPTSTSASSGDSTPSSSSLPGPVVDDYPEEYKQHCGEIDQWFLTACQCVSFVAFRVSDRLDQDFTRAFEGETWSNANTWSQAAEEAGVLVNNTPAPGAIAQTNAGEWGHVAWVVAVEPGNQIRIEEYNALHPLGYDTRIVDISYFENYIHIPMA